MRAITTQKEVQSLQKLSFCYLCGKPFTKSCQINREHVVAKNLINHTDRNFPLVLPSHTACNGSQSEHDETIGQLVQLLHSTKAKSHKLELTGYYSEEKLKAGTVSGIAFEPIIWRWVRGFHSALYF